MCCLYQTLIVQISANDDTGRIQIVIQSLGFTQEFRAEDNILAVELLTNRSGVTNRNRGLDDHDSVRVILHDQLDHRLNSRCVEVLGVAIVVGRGRNNNKVRIRVCSLCIQCCGQIQIFFCQIFFDIVILNRGFLIVNHIDLSLHNIDCNHLMVLREQHSQRKTYISRASHSDFIIFHSSVLPH